MAPVRFRITSALLLFSCLFGVDRGAPLAYGQEGPKVAVVETLKVDRKEVELFAALLWIRYRTTQDELKSDKRAADRDALKALQDKYRDGITLIDGVTPDEKTKVAQVTRDKGTLFTMWGAFSKDDRQKLWTFPSKLKEPDIKKNDEFLGKFRKILDTGLGANFFQNVVDLTIRKSQKLNESYTEFQAALDQLISPQFVDIDPNAPALPALGDLPPLDPPLPDAPSSTSASQVSPITQGGGP